MVKTIIFMLAATTVVHARPVDVDSYDDEVDDDEPAFNMLGFRFGFGALPRDGGRMTTLSIGLGVEHPVFDRTRVFGEYEWLWFSHHSEREMDVGIRLERGGTGHRSTIGLRRELLAKGFGRMRMFVDVELGGGLAVASDHRTGLELVPAGVAGLRFGYDLYSRSDDSPSRTFETELLFRAIAVEDGIGAMLGAGMLWGN